MPRFSFPSHNLRRFPGSKRKPGGGSFVGPIDLGSSGPWRRTKYFLGFEKVEGQRALRKGEASQNGHNVAHFGVVGADRTFPRCT